MSTKLDPRINAAIAAHLAAMPDADVAAWCEANVVIPPPQTPSPGPFSLAGWEYMREPLNCFGDGLTQDLVLCLGSQLGKTTLLMGGLGWTLANMPSSALWVMPGAVLGGSFSENRWTPVVRATPPLARLIPTGSERFAFKRAEQRLGASLLTFVGSHSAANLASRPARLVIMDEVDKFDDGGKGEADAVDLAEQRTKAQPFPLRVKTSTPTLTDGLIWQQFVRGDQRRCFLPCPHCGCFVVLAWSREFTVLPITGAEAWIRWDKSARRADKTWNLDAVAASAHAECPHCHGRIEDAHKTKMLRGLEWRATAAAPSSFRSYHLPSLYGTGPNTSFGKIAVQFLQASGSLLGLQGFVNGMLAEPWEAQDSRSERTELVVVSDTPAPGTAPLPILTADVQEVAPYFWFVVRLWYAEGHSRRIAWGHCDSWDELRALQIEHGVSDNHVGVDSGYDAQTVYSECLRWGKMVKIPNGPMPMWVGWTPLDGRPGYAKFRDPKTKQPRLYDFSSARLSHTRFRLPLLAFNSWAFKDIIAKLRKGPTAAAGLRWEVGEDPKNETYWRHLDAEVKAETNRGRYEWKLRSKRWPNHLLDCEVMQLAMANFHRRLPWAATPSNTPLNANTENTDA